MQSVRRKVLSAAMTAVLVLGLCPAVAAANEATGGAAEPQASGAQVQRLYGETAAETASKIAAEVTSQSDYVVVARDDDYADALGSVGLAGVQKAPIVLTDRFALSDAARSSLTSCGAKTVYLIGGTGAVKQEVEDAIAAMGIQVVRVFGTDASDTSIACAEKIAQIKQERGEATDKAVVAMSDGFQDALSASSYAYYYGTPVILLSSSDNAANRVLKDEAVQLLSGSGAYANANILAPGGTGAMPAASVEGVLGESRVTRVFGETGYDTSNQLAWYFTENNLLSAETVCVACGAADPKGVDALAGSALAGSRGGVIVLATSNPAVGDTDKVTLTGTDSKGKPAFLTSNASSVAMAYVLGGFFVLPSDIFNKVATLTGCIDTCYEAYKTGDIVSLRGYIKEVVWQHAGMGEQTSFILVLDDPASFLVDMGSGDVVLYEDVTEVQLWEGSLPDCSLGLPVTVTAEVGFARLNQWQRRDVIFDDCSITPDAAWLETAKATLNVPLDLPVATKTSSRTHWDAAGIDLVWVEFSYEAPEGTYTASGGMEAVTGTSGRSLLAWGIHSRL